MYKYGNLATEDGIFSINHIVYLRANTMRLPFYLKHKSYVKATKQLVIWINIKTAACYTSCTRPGVFFKDVFSYFYKNGEKGISCRIFN